MRLVVYNTVKEYWNENKEFLLEKEPISQLIIVNAMKNLDNLASKECFFGSIYDDENKPIISFGNTSPFNLIIYSPYEEVNKTSIHMIIDYLVKENIVIRGINAKKIVIDIFNDYYEKKTGIVLEEHFAMDIMQIKEVRENKLAPGYFRKATLDDLDLLVKWQLLSAIEIDNSELKYEDVKTRIETEINQEDVFIYENEEHVSVTTVSAVRKLIGGIVVGRVYTPKDQRCKGYSTACMDYFSRHYLNSGVGYCTLFVEKKNPFSNSVYRKVGYEVLEENYDYRVKDNR